MCSSSTKARRCVTSAAGEAGISAQLLCVYGGVLGAAGRRERWSGGCLMLCGCCGAAAVYMTRRGVCPCKGGVQSTEHRPSMFDVVITEFSSAARERVFGCTSSNFECEHVAGTAGCTGSPSPADCPHTAAPTATELRLRVEQQQDCLAAAACRLTRPGAASDPCQPVRQAQAPDRAQPAVSAGKYPTACWPSSVTTPGWCV